MCWSLGMKASHSHSLQIPPFAALLLLVMRLQVSQRGAGLSAVETFERLPPCLAGRQSSTIVAYSKVQLNAEPTLLLHLLPHSSLTHRISRNHIYPTSLPSPNHLIICIVTFNASAEHPAFTIQLHLDSASHTHLHSLCAAALSSGRVKCTHSTRFRFGRTHALLIKLNLFSDTHTHTLHLHTLSASA